MLVSDFFVLLMSYSVWVKAPWLTSVGSVFVIYEVKLFEGTLTITPDQVKNSQNFKWSFYKDTSDAAFAANTLASATVNPVSTTTLETNHTLAPNGVKVTYYVMVWLNDTGAPQNEDQAASYTGAVQFTTASNAVIRAEF